MLLLSNKVDVYVIWKKTLSVDLYIFQSIKNHWKKTTTLTTDEMYAT